MADAGNLFSLGSLPLIGGVVGDTIVSVTPLSLGDVGSAFLLSVTPADGSELSPDPEIARFTPVTGRFTVLAGEGPLMFVVIGTMWWLIYDGTQFSPFFREHSTIAVTGDHEYTASVIPNGGWWRSSVRVEFLSGKILTPPT